MLSTILLQRQTFLGYQRVANMRNHTSCPYTGLGKQVQRAFQGIWSWLRLCRKCIQIAHAGHLQRIISSIATNFLPFAMGDCFSFLTQVITELSLCCNGYRSTVFSLSKQMFTGKMWTYSDRMNTQKKNTPIFQNQKSQQKIY